MRSEPQRGCGVTSCLVHAGGGSGCGALGAFDSLQATPRNALIQVITPDAIRGRVEAFRHMLTGGMPALGQVYMGGTASLLGTPLALVVGAVACAVILVGITVGRADVRARELDEERETEAAPVAAAT